MLNLPALPNVNVAAVVPTIGDVGAGALLALVVLLILGGWLVPRRVLADAQRDRDNWRDLALELAGQNAILVDGGRTTVEALRAIVTEATTPDQREIVS